MLLRKIFFKRVQRTSLLQRSTTNFASLCTFEIPVAFKHILGRRVLIVTQDDEESREKARRIWFSMQKSGKDSVNYAVKTLFPSAKEVREAVDFAKRAGIDSILAFGEPPVTEAAKAIREALETGVYFTHISDIAPSVLRSSIAVPLVLAPSMVSLWSALPMWNCLDAEEDFVQQSRCKSADLVVFDENIVQGAQQYDVEMDRHLLIAYTFDIVFMYLINHALDYEGATYDEMKNFLISKLEPLRKFLSGPASKQTIVKFNAALNTICTELATHNSTKYYDPSLQLVAQLSLLRLLHGPFAKESLKLVNQSWISIDIFRRILKNDALFKKGVSGIGESNTFRQAFLDAAEILQLNKSNRAVLIDEISRYISTSNIKVNGVSLKDSLMSDFAATTTSAAGAVEGLLFIEESLLLNKVPENRNINDKGPLVTMPNNQFKKIALLRSDFLFEIVDSL